MITRMWAHDYSTEAGDYICAFRSHHLIRFRGCLGLVCGAFRPQERSKRVQERSERVQEALKGLSKRLSDAFGVEIPSWTLSGRLSDQFGEAQDLKNQ